MSPPILADCISAAEHLLNNYTTNRGPRHQCECLAAGLRQAVEGLKLVVDQEIEFLHLVHRLAGLVNQLAGRVEVLEKREQPG
jgi:hypothetical protein